MKPAPGLLRLMYLEIIEVSRKKENSTITLGPVSQRVLDLAKFMANSWT